MRKWIAAKPFAIVIPHKHHRTASHGTRAHNTMQDILIRYKRMPEVQCAVAPGADHASIATEVKVIENLKKQGIDKHDLGREGFLEKCYEWKDEYGSRIINQLKKMGFLRRLAEKAFYHGPGCSDAVLEVFVKLYEKRTDLQGLPHCQLVPGLQDLHFRCRGRA